MINVSRVLGEMEIIMSDIAFSGVENIQPVLLTRLSSCGEMLSRLGMERGEKVTKSVIDAISRFRSGEGTVEETVSTFCSLEFYFKNIQNL